MKLFILAGVLVLLCFFWIGRQLFIAPRECQRCHCLIPKNCRECPSCGYTEKENVQ